MSDRSYYSVRSGLNPNSPSISLNLLLRLFKDLYLHFEQQGYFQEYFGYSCVDAGDVSGKLGHDIDAVVLRKLRKETLWPIPAQVEEYSEHDLFDMVEFLHDHVSTPIDGFFHSFSDCGWHYSEFEQVAGQMHFRNEINPLLRDYSSGYRLSDRGEIELLADEGLASLIGAEIPEVDEQNVSFRIRSAIRKFRTSRSTWEDRRDAIRDLADVLEYLRPQVKEVLTSNDESDLYEIANRFGIRHHRADQLTDYDEYIFYSWMFYYYLATIHASMRLLQRNESSRS